MKLDDVTGAEEERLLEPHLTRAKKLDSFIVLEMQADEHGFKYYRETVRRSSCPEEFDAVATFLSLFSGEGNRINHYKMEEDSYVHENPGTIGLRREIQLKNGLVNLFYDTKDSLTWNPSKYGSDIFKNWHGKFLERHSKDSSHYVFSIITKEDDKHNSGKGFDAFFEIKLLSL